MLETLRETEHDIVPLLLDERLSEDFSLLDFIIHMEKISGLPVDAVVLNRAGEVLKHHIRKTGRSTFLIEACIDIARHIIADERFREPDSYRDAFAVLAENDIINSEDLKSLKKLQLFEIYSFTIMKRWTTKSSTGYSKNTSMISICSAGRSCLSSKEPPRIAGPACRSDI